MAFVRDFSLDSLSSNSTSFTGTLPTYATGDILIWFVAKDSTVGGTNTTPSGWTALDTWSDNAIKGAVFYKENVTGGSETDPQTTNTDSDTWSGVIVSIGGVATSGNIEANVRIDTVQGNGGERGFTGPTTLTNNALVLHCFLNSGLSGCGTDQKLQIVTEEVGYTGESVYVFKETVPTAGASAAGNQLQNANVATTYIGLSIADGSSGSDVEPYQTDGGMTDLLNGFQAAETISWLPSGMPSGITTDAFGTYGNLTTVNGSAADRFQDAGDKGVSFFLSAASTRGDRNNYQGLRFECDRSGGLATYDLTGKHIAGQMMMDVAKFSVQIGKRAVLGYGVFLEDNAGNWKCFCINGSDSVRLFISALDGPFLIDPSSSDVIDSSGTLDITNIQYMGFVVNGLSFNNITTMISNIFIYEPIEVVGGTATQLITYDRLDSFGYGNMQRFRKVLGGASALVGAWHIGDGSVDTFLSIDGESIGFPETNSSGGLLIDEGFMGFKLTGTASSDLSFINTTIASPSEWKWDQANALGTQTYTGLTLTRAKPINTDTGDYSNGTFTSCGTITQNGATMDNVTIDNSLDSVGFIWGTGSNTGLTVRNCTTGIQVASAGSISFDNVSFSGNTTDLDFSGTGTLTVDLANGSDTPVTTTSGGGTIVITQNVNITDENLIDDSRVQIYNVTKGAELDNSVVSGGSGYSFTANLADASIDEGDTIRLRATYQTGVVAMEELEVSGVVTGSGLTFTNSQTSHEVFDAYGVDGSTITEFSFDSGNIEVDINDTDNTTQIQRLACWETYFETTEQGIRDFFGCINWESLNSIKIEVAMCDLKLDNVKVNPLQITGGRLYRSDGTTVIASGSNSIQIDYEPVYIGNADDITEIKATIDANLDTTVSSRSTQTSVDNLNNLSASDVATELATYDAPTKAEMDAGFSALNNFDPASDTVTVGSTSEDSIVDKVWDEVIDNANHNTAKSAGKRLRQAGTSLSAEGTVDDPSPTVSSFITDLTQTNTSFYADQTMIFLSGDLEGQARLITSYNGTTKVVTFDEPWTVAPADTDEFEIKADHVHPVTEIQEGLATSANVTDAQTDIILEIDANEAKIDTLDTNLDTLVADLVDGGRLDLLIDAIDANVDQVLIDLADIDADVAASPAVIYSYFTQGGNAEEFKSTYNAKAPELNRVLNLVKTPKRDKKSGRR